MTVRHLFGNRNFLVLLLAALFLTASYSLDAQQLEQQLFHAIVPVLPAQSLSDSPVVSIVLDDDTASHFGGELYSHDLLARVIRKLSQERAATIALALPLTLSQTSPEMENLRKSLKNASAAERKLLRTWADRLDPDARLASAIRRAKNVVLLAPLSRTGLEWKNTLPSRFYLQREDSDKDFRARLERQIYQATILPRLTPVLPRSGFLAGAARLGFSQESHRNLMALPLFYSNQDKLLPAFTLTALTHFMNTDLKDINLDKGNLLSLGINTVHTGPDFQFAPYPAFDDKKAQQRQIPLAQYLKLDNSASLVRDRLVIIGIDQNARFTHNDPTHRGVPRVQQLDRALNSLLSDTYITIPDWFIAGQRLLLLIFTVYLLITATRFSHRTSLIVQSVLIIALANTWFIALSVKHTWLPMAFPLAFLVSTQLILSVRTMVLERVGRLSMQLLDARCALARNLQSQGQLDQAMDELARCPQVNELREPLYQLALDMERRRFFPKAMELYRRIAAIDSDYRDIKSRRKNLDDLPGPIAGKRSNGGSTLIATMVASGGSMAKPMLGRYQIEHELGQGAMGVVYLGVDPKIGRKVAIKTLSLVDEFEGEDLKEAQQRFFREAEAAGRLDHPNIITIYDAGEEHDLAYIAMDYAPGQSLDNFVRKGQLLPVRDILHICASVAEALDYAHMRNVVHRDVKPSNIIYDAEADSVKITDFGIAFLADDSRTRSGLILGSPSYMSPEQVAGKKLDGRSDLYSLGVTLYQLLTGQLPFAGDSLANLMYKITHDKHAPVSKLRKGIPACAVRIVNKALQKDAGKRYQSGEEMAEALERCAG